jgi:hypothetical protein
MRAGGGVIVSVVDGTILFWGRCEGIVRVSMVWTGSGRYYFALWYGLELNNSDASTT